MTDVFEVAKPKEVVANVRAQVPIKPKPTPKPRQPPVQDVIAHVDTVLARKTRRKRTPRVADPLDEHMLFMKLYTELRGLPKGARSKLLESLMRQLT